MMHYNITLLYRIVTRIQIQTPSGSGVPKIHKLFFFHSFLFFFFCICSNVYINIVSFTLLFIRTPITYRRGTENKTNFIYHRYTYIRGLADEQFYGHLGGNRWDFAGKSSVIRQRRNDTIIRYTVVYIWICMCIYRGRKDV